MECILNEKSAMMRKIILFALTLAFVSCENQQELPNPSIDFNALSININEGLDLTKNYLSSNGNNFVSTNSSDLDVNTRDLFLGATQNLAPNLDLAIVDNMLTTFELRAQSRVTDVLGLEGFNYFSDIQIEYINKLSANLITISSLSDYIVFLEETENEILSLTATDDEKIVLFTIYESLKNFALDIQTNNLSWTEGIVDINTSNSRVDGDDKEKDGQESNSIDWTEAMGAALQGGIVSGVTLGVIWGLEGAVVTSVVGLPVVGFAVAGTIGFATGFTTGAILNGGANVAKQGFENAMENNSSN